MKKKLHKEKKVGNLMPEQKKRKKHLKIIFSIGKN